jgi:transposase-like protein
MLIFAFKAEVMTIRVNQEQVNDTAKLMMHRLIARAIGRDPSLIDRAKISLNRSSSERYEGYSFVSEWSDLLRLPPVKVRRRLTSRAVKSAALESASTRIVA